jgi:acyl transferase domain-containing protein
MVERQIEPSGSIYNAHACPQVAVGVWRLLSLLPIPKKAKGVQLLTVVVPANCLPVYVPLQLVEDLPVQFGVFLDSADLFDAAAFGISGPEAALLDPQQRLLMEAAAETLTASSSSTMRSAGSSTGVFIGISSMDYNKVSVKYLGSVTPYTSTGASLSVAAGRLSYSFALSGPSVSVDTACSSSLVAAHSAVNALQLDQAAAALAGGVNLTLSPDTPAAFQKAGGLILLSMTQQTCCKYLSRGKEGLQETAMAVC